MEDIVTHGIAIVGIVLAFITVGSLFRLGWRLTDHILDRNHSLYEKRGVADSGREYVWVRDATGKVLYFREK